MHHYLFLAALLFVCGLTTMLLKRNAIGILMGVELILNAANINLVAFNHFAYPGAASRPLMDGQIFALFIIVFAAAEAAVAL
ncbi:MAG TPA: NADH-quinone oxidoreductase subunit NuoK, partial [Tepidisphaeraceae bacterium]